MPIPTSSIRLVENFQFIYDFFNKLINGFRPNIYKHRFIDVCASLNTTIHDYMSSFTILTEEVKICSNNFLPYFEFDNIESFRALYDDKLYNC